MKGVITKYDYDRGFGFIFDENENVRFFHISSVVDRDEFLRETHEYLCSDIIEDNCFIVKFSPGQNEKGLLALNLNLTEQVLNDKSDEQVFDTKIVELKYEVDICTGIMQGIKKGEDVPLGATAGGDGTYRIGYPEVFKKLIIIFKRVDDIGWGKIEIRELALNLNKRRKITKKFISALENKLLGKIVKVTTNQNNWILADSSVLVI